MHESSLEKLLHSYRSQTEVPCPASLEKDVWREIRLRREAAGRPAYLGWQAFVELFGRPRIAFAALALALVTGIVSPVIQGAASHRMRTEAPLKLSAFSTQSPNLPSTILSREIR